MRKSLLAACLLACASPAFAQPVPSYVVPLNPCRVFQTLTGSPLAANTTTQVDVRGVCNVPEEANAVFASVHAVNGPSGYTLAWEACLPQPGAATSASTNTAGESSGTLIRLSYPAGECPSDFQLYNSNSTHISIDVTGYMVPIGTEE